MNNDDSNSSAARIAAFGARRQPRADLASLRIAAEVGAKTLLDPGVDPSKIFPEAAAPVFTPAIQESLEEPSETSKPRDKSARVKSPDKPVNDESEARVGCKIPKKLHTELKIHCVSRGITMSDLFAELIEDFCKKIKK